MESEYRRFIPDLRVLIYITDSFRFDKAAQLFQSALDLAQVTQSSQKAWVTTYLNLGTCYRKLK